MVLWIVQNDIYSLSINGQSIEDLIVTEREILSFYKSLYKDFPSKAWFSNWNGILNLTKSKLD